MAVYTKRKVIDLDATKDNEIKIGTVATKVKVFTDNPELYVNKDVVSGKITLTSEDIVLLNFGHVRFEDEYGVTSTDYYIPEVMNTECDINALNISRLNEKVMSIIGTQTLSQTEYDALTTKENKLYFIKES